MTDAEIFRLLDHIAAGFEREAQLSEAEHEAKREEILAWFLPLHAQLQAAYFERPCPIPWTLTLRHGVDVPPPPEPHECADCFNAVYDAWKRARGRTTILPTSRTSVLTGSAASGPPAASFESRISGKRGACWPTTRSRLPPSHPRWR